MLLFASTLLFNPFLGCDWVIIGGDFVEPGDEELVLRDESIINFCAAVGDLAFSILPPCAFCLSADSRAFTPLLLSDPIWLQVCAKRASGLFLASN